MRMSKAMELFGTLKNIATLLGVAPSTVADWRKKGAIPIRFHEQLKQLAEQGHQFEDKSMPFQEALEKFGTVNAISAAIGVNPKTVYFWKDSGVVPDGSAQKIRAYSEKVA
jgi:DNA-binding transcriptional regulator YdaS (Cro superfamily)